MNAKRPTSCWLATANAASRSIARAILTSQDITPLDLKPELLFAPHPAPGVQPDPEGILLLDLAPDCIGERGAAAALRQAQALPWRPRLLGFSGVARLPWANETGLARKLTGNPLLPRPESAPGEFMTSLLAQTGGGSVDATRLERHLRVLAGGGEQSADARILRMTGDYRLRREDAAVLGDALMQAGYLHHVVKQQPFSDAEFFYRVAAPGRFDALPIEDVYALLRDTRGVVADRAWRGVSFPQCMVGGEVVDLLAGQYRLSRLSCTSSTMTPTPSSF